MAQAQKKKDDGCLKDQVCKDRYNQALKLYDEGRFAEALPEFQAAYTRRQMPWLLLNIGRTMQRLGRPSEAISYYERYKKAEPNIDAETEQRVNKYIEQSRALTDPMPDPGAAPKTPPAGTDAQTGTAGTPATGTQPAAVNLLPAPQTGPADRPPAATPVYKKWWFWTIIGVVAAGAIAGGVAGGLAARPKDPPAEPFQPSDPIYTPSF